jgi:hypothetical protein
MAERIDITSMTELKTWISLGVDGAAKWGHSQLLALKRLSDGWVCLGEEEQRVGEKR